MTGAGLLAVGALGKIAGAHLGGRVQRVSARDVGVVAVFMNARGVTKLVVRGGREIELAHAGMQSLERIGVVGG